MTVLYFSALALFLLITLVLCLVILVQESKSGGLGSAFGADSGDSLFGASTLDVLKKFTAILAIVFFSSCLLLSFWTASLARNQAHRAMPQMEQETPSSHK